MAQRRYNRVIDHMSRLFLIEFGDDQFRDIQCVIQQRYLAKLPVCAGIPARLHVPGRRLLRDDGSTFALPIKKHEELGNDSSMLYVYFRELLVKSRCSLVLQLDGLKCFLFHIGFHFPWLTPDMGHAVEGYLDLPSFFLFSKRREFSALLDPDRADFLERNDQPFSVTIFDLLFFLRLPANPNCPADQHHARHRDNPSQNSQTEGPHTV